MMAFLRSRNDSLEPGFEKIAVEYMRRGEDLGLRWDYAFFQMAIETNYLSFRREGGRRSDVRPSQNNFAGLGATGNGVHGESFKDMSTGVLAHLQHVLAYSGEEVEEPVAERTRNLIKWGVLKSFHQKIKGPVTYTHLAQKWATSSDYASAIETHAQRFYSQFCKIADPAPEQLAEVRGDATKRKVAQAAATPPAQPAVTDRVSGAELARRALEEGRGEQMSKPLGLGAASLAAAVPRAEERTEDRPQVETRLTILNAPRPGLVPGKPEAPAADTPRAQASKPAAKAEAAPKADAVAKTEPKAEKKIERPASFQTASAGGLAKSVTTPPAGTRCRVWTASYGGQKAIIIKVDADKAVNYTVLDVNEGTEKREAEAYIAAYAKGGVIAGEFTSQTQALDKAFELCPEG